MDRNFDRSSDGSRGGYRGGARGRGGRGGRGGSLHPSDADQRNTSTRGGRGGRGDFGDRSPSARGGRGDYYSRSPSTRGDRSARGDRGGRGDRGSRGGRGGGRGDRPSHQAIRIDGVEPTPDEEITNLENSILTRLTATDSLTSQMQNLDLKSGSSKGKGSSKGSKGSKGKASSSKQTEETKPDSSAGMLLPIRPAFGTNGRPVVVWANYFKVDAKASTLFKYTMTVCQLLEDGVTIKEQKDGTPRPIKGQELHSVIAKLVEHIGTSSVVATEFKSQLVCREPLTINDEVEISVFTDSDHEDDVATGGRHETKYLVYLSGPVEVSLASLVQYLTSMEVAAWDMSFPKFPEVIDSLNTILGHKSRSMMNDVTVVGSSRFFPFGSGKIGEELAGRQHRLLEAARGMFQSTSIGTGRLLLNANVTHGVFRLSGKFLELFQQFGISAALASNRQQVKAIATFEKFLPKTKIYIITQNQNGDLFRMTKRMQGFAVGSELRRRCDAKLVRIGQGFEYPGPKNIEFLNKETGHFISVYDYYKQKYKAELGDLPVLRVGTFENPKFYPAEFCAIIAGQSIKTKLNSQETTIMLRFACRTPLENALSLINDSREVLSHDDPGLENFGVKVDKTLLAIHARVLDCPTVSYLDNRSKTVPVTPRSGSWNMRSVRVCKPGRPFERWTWVNISPSRGSYRPVRDDVVLEFAKFMNENMGIKISKTPLVSRPRELSWDDVMYTSKLETMFADFHKQEIQLVLFVLPEKDSTGMYNKIKTLGDCVYGIHTSCLVSSTFGKGSPAYFANVGLKINLKAGGVNHQLRDESPILRDGKTMIVGYDVTHPTNMSPAKSKTAPSLVGLVASVDGDYAQWPAASWEQSSKQEMLSDILNNAFASRLELWKSRNNNKTPDNIIIFRDGVSEGQFSQVLSEELPHIREACKRVCGARIPKLSIIVSVKRHQTRFYPTKDSEMSNSGNIKNGTVVDRGITQARYWDFYLTAHDALQGTSRPAHYTVLLDEVFRPKYQDQAANQLERLTHELCYLFGRATKAVSICPPAYYADIVCERARAHRPEYFDASDAESVTNTSSSGSPFAENSRDIHPSLKNTMYYI